MFYIVEVTHFDESRQIGLAALEKDYCIERDIPGIGINDPHNHWTIPKDSPIRDGLVKSVKPIRELKQETEATTTTMIDILLATKIGV